MKRASAFIISFFIVSAMLFGGCAHSDANVSGELVAAGNEPAANSYFTLNIRCVDESENEYVFTDCEFTLQNGYVLSAGVENGSVNIEKFPVATGISCAVKDGQSRRTDFKLSFWTGYASAYRSNLNTVSVDMPGNVETLFLTVKINDDGKVKCTGMSEVDFDDEDVSADDFEGALGKDQIAAVGMYGSRAVTEAEVKLREEPSTESEVLRKMHFADVVVLMEAAPEDGESEWYHVKYDEYEGYISGEYLGNLFTVNKNGVNIRKEPSADSDSVNLVSSGARVVALDDGQTVNEEKWYYVATRSGIKGYIRSDFIG